MDAPAFLICLERLRLDYCKQHIAKLKEIFPHKLTGIHSAVDASNINIMEDPRISPFAKYNIQHAIDSDYMHLSKKSAIGCSLSHIQLWQKAVALNEPIFVVEDDVEISKGFITEAVSRIPHNVDHAAIIYLPFVDRSLCGEFWCDVQPRYGFGGTQMYYITPNGARILLQHALPIVVEIDQYMGYIASVHSNYSSVFYKEQFMTSYKILRSQLYEPSTMHRSFSFRKILPEGNLFYILVIMLFAFMCSRLTFKSKCTAKTRKKKELDV